MSFLEEMRTHTKDLRERVFSHPFVLGIGDGTLDETRFRFYLAQDYRFLIEYARVLGLASAKSRDFETQARFAELLDATLGTEMQLHRNVCAGYGLSSRDLERTEPARACFDYTQHLIDVAWSGTLGEICASLVPCQYGYAEIAGALEDGSPDGNPYAEWIAAYTSTEYRELAAWMCGLSEQLAGDATEDERDAMRRAYFASARHEVAFWDMAWNGA